jgi:1-acyl-sn-glycerol-3-phosphate acyltransferase
MFDRMRRSLGLTHGEDPGLFDARAIQDAETTVGRLYGQGRYFDTSIRGFEHVPPPPVLVVSNHSGGTTIPDVWGLGFLWYRHFGYSRPLFVLAHELLFATPQTGRYFERAGVLRATPTVANRVLAEHKRDLLVLPGGDLDTWRPWSERNTVHFGGRTGYARLAIRTKTPIVPVAHVGAHETLMVLRTGKRIAKWLGMQRLARAEVWPLHLSLPWGLALGPLPHLPVPARFQYLVGPPIYPPPEETLDAVRALDARVRSVIQVQLNQLAEERHRRW